VKNMLEGIKIINPKTFEDTRGCFFESYNDKIRGELGIEKDFLQDNHSISHKNVVRGLHYQWDNPMGKLVRVVKGSLVDYFLDIREGSPTYGKHDSIFLSEENKTMVWIPEGFAHGFESLEENTVILYKCTSLYNKDGEGVINPLDEDAGIKWNTPREKILMSERDNSSQSFSAYCRDPKFSFSKKE
jgi:dTDP-4-dehydrorhamnose 3,5-epimerase